jgi:hypothetical protein
MLLLEDFEKLRGSIRFAWDSQDCDRISKQFCLICQRRQIYYGWANPKTGRGFAVCQHCGVVEELWIDRDGDDQAAGTKITSSLE